MAQQPPTGTSVLRRLNTSTVLAALRQRPRAALRIAELVQSSGLTRPTVQQSVDDLVASGWIALDSDRDDAPRVGRPAARYRLRPRALPVLGIDAGPHQVSAGIADLTGQTLALVRRQLPGPAGVPAILSMIDEALHACLIQAELGVSDIDEVVVGSPGVIDTVRGSVRLAPSVPGWPGAELLSHLRERLRCPLHLENDANLAALEAASQFPGETLLVIQWGERLGAGIVIAGAVHQGADGAAGEIGFISAAGQDAGADAAGQGPLERDVGAHGVVQAARAAAARYPRSLLAALPEAELTATAVFRAAGRGDQAAVAVVGAVADRFAAAVAPVVLALNPHAVVIGGGLARAGAVLLDALRPRLAARTLSPPRLELSHQAERAVVAGAMRLAREHVWRRRLSGPSGAAVSASRSDVDGTTAGLASG
jgi:predicted NBD/HSP70 family sugar kinase